MEHDSELNREFGAAYDNPNDFDFGFVAQREQSGFANFGFDPAEAARLRAEEDEDFYGDPDDDFECDDEDCDIDHDDDTWYDDDDEWEEVEDDEDDEDSFTY